MICEFAFDKAMQQQLDALSSSGPRFEHVTVPKLVLTFLPVLSLEAWLLSASDESRKTNSAFLR